MGTHLTPRRQQQNISLCTRLSAKMLTAYLPYTVQAHFCCFNQDKKQAIIDGFKRKIAPEEAMTGQEFCDLLELDYMEIVRARREYGPENMREFLADLVKIESVSKSLRRLLGV